MRHIGLALGTLALILALTWGNMRLVTRQLDGIDAALAAAQRETGTETLAAARQLWETADDWLYATQPHQTVDEVGAALARAETYAAEGRTEEARAEVAAARDAVQTLRYRERLTLDNIF